MNVESIPPMYHILIIYKSGKSINRKKMNIQIVMLRYMLQGIQYERKMHSK